MNIFYFICYDNQILKIQRCFELRFKGKCGEKLDLISGEPTVTYFKATFESSQIAFHKFLPKSCGILMC